MLLLFNELVPATIVGGRSTVNGDKRVDDANKRAFIAMTTQSPRDGVAAVNEVADGAGDLEGLQHRFARLDHAHVPVAAMDV